MTDTATMTDTTVVHNVSPNLLRQWSIFHGLDEEELGRIKSLYSFHSPSVRGCRGGIGAIVITTDDEAYGVGHNCTFINVLGFHSLDTEYKKEEVLELTKISTLSYKKINQMSIGGLIGAALSDCGTLYWWGHCYNSRNGELVTPHIPRTGRRRYVRVSCGYHLMAALSLSGSVYVWGQVVHNTSRFVEGLRILLNSTIAEISCGLHHLAIMDTDGFVYTWGRGDEGQRGVLGYTKDVKYMVKKMFDEPCIDVKCGPYATFCLTSYHELKVCGSNRHLGLGLSQSHPISTLTSICLDGAVTDIFVVGLSDHTAVMTARTSDGDFYTWGAAHTSYPRLAEAGSFMEVFTSWSVTPELMSIQLKIPHPVGWPVFPLSEEYSVVGDVLVYIYLRDRPDLVNESSRFLLKSKSRHLANLANQITTEESGREFVLQKFIHDLGTKDQFLPDDFDDYFEEDVCCSCPYHPGGGFSFYV